MSNTPLLLTHTRAAGDIVVMSAVFRDIRAKYGDRFSLEAFVSTPSVLRENPHIAQIRTAPRPGIQTYKLDYGGSIKMLHTDRQHFLTAFHKNLAVQTNGEIAPDLTAAKPDLHLTDDEKKYPLVSGRYWLLMAGRKSDATTKMWSPHRWQQLVDILRELGIPLVQAGATYRGHWNSKLNGVTSLVGKTTLRELMSLVYHAEGVICPITCAMHMAAAFDKPCVVIAGGREHWWWEAYTNTNLKTFGDAAAPVVVPHRYLHTQGLLSCCEDKGCWKNKTTELEKDNNKSYCTQPDEDHLGHPIPRCLKMITVTHVVEAVMSYYKDGTLPPIGPAPQIIMPSGEFLRPNDAGDLAARKVQAPKESKLAGVRKELIIGDAGPELAAPPKLLRQPAGMDVYAKQTQDGESVTTESPFDHKIIGGMYTICVLLYGDYFDMHKRCINSIISTTPQNRRELRVFLNAVCPDTEKYIDKLHSLGHVYKVYLSRSNKKKYPAMRIMYHDEKHPIKTKWVIWFDDDSIAERDPDWFLKLTQTIIAHYPHGCHIYGAQFSWKFHPQQMAWIKSRPWYRGIPFQMQNGMPAPNGDHVVFPAGGFVALSTEMIRKQDIPDPEIGHNGGDYMVAEQVWQGGGKLKNWNGSKQFIHTSSVARRGLHEIHTGMPGWRPGGVEDPARLKSWK